MHTLGNLGLNVLLQLWIDNLPQEMVFAETTHSRIWKKNVDDSVYFNDFIESNLANDILKRVIMNNMSGRFKSFDRMTCLGNLRALTELVLLTIAMI